MHTSDDINTCSRTGLASQRHARDEPVGLGQQLLRGRICHTAALQQRSPNGPLVLVLVSMP